jgi:hypothetical protein
MTSSDSTAVDPLHEEQNKGLIGDDKVSSLVTIDGRPTAVPVENATKRHSSAELRDWLRQPRPYLAGVLTDAGDCRDGYKHGSNPRFDGLPWHINEPIALISSASRKRFFDWLVEHALVANERVEDVRENPDVVLAAWTAKYNKQHNSPTDPNYGRQLPIFIKPKPQRAQDVPGPNNTPSLITMIDAGRKTGRTFLRPAPLRTTLIPASGFLPGTQIRIFSASGEPKYITPGEDCFSEPSRFLVDVEWQAADGRVLHAQRTEEIPGGRGGGAAKTQIDEEDFVPAELPAESEMRWWEDRINKSITDFAEQHPGEPQPIVRQDRHGNLVGQHFNMVRRTTVSQPQRQQELDRKVEEARRRRIDATLTKEDELVLTTRFGKPVAEAAGELNISEAAMRKRAQRFGRDGEVTKEMIGLAVHETYPTRSEQRAGWHVLIRMPGCAPYVRYLGDLPEVVSEEVIQKAWTDTFSAELDRLIWAKIKKLGLMKNGFTSTNEPKESTKRMIHRLQFALHQGFRRGGASPLYLTYKDRGDDRILAWQCWSAPVDLTGLSTVAAMAEGQEGQNPDQQNG